jgi:ABC-type Fe3+ transport system permease subunit
MSSLHTAGWAIIGTVSIGIASIVRNVFLARKSRSQAFDQAANQLKQAAATLDVQRTSTARAGPPSLPKSGRSG